MSITLSDLQTRGASELIDPANAPHDVYLGIRVLTFTA